MSEPVGTHIERDPILVSAASVYAGSHNHFLDFARVLRTPVAHIVFFKTLEISPHLILARALMGSYRAIAE